MKITFNDRLKKIDDNCSVIKYICINNYFWRVSTPTGEGHSNSRPIKLFHVKISRKISLQSSNS